MNRPVLTLRGRIGDRSVTFPLFDGVHEIGRASTCDIRLDEPSVSCRHARLEIRGSAARVEDLGSSNGTRLNGVPLTEPTDVRHGDRLDLGNIILSVEGGPVSADLYLEQTNIREGLAVSFDEARRTHVDDRNKKAFLFRILAEAGQLLTRPQDPDEIFDPLLVLVEKALQPERVFLLLKDEDNENDEEMPEIVASRVRTGGPGGMILSQTLIRRVLEQRTAFLTEDASQDQRLLGGDSIVGSGTRSAMAAPLFDNEKVIGLLYADTTNPSVHYDRDELKGFVLLANVVAVAITHARFHALEEERRRLRTELGAARRIMSRLLPRELPEMPGVDVSAYLESCEEVAGDLYDVRELPDGKLLLVVGDVAGKGLAAALIVAGLLPAIRIVMDENLELGGVTARVNEQLYASTDAVRFATLFIGVLDPTTGHLYYVNAGHNPPLLINCDGDLTTLPSVGPPVGMIPDVEYPVSEVQMGPTCRLVFYSDGLTEAMNEAEEMYGDERLQDLLRDAPASDAKTLEKHVLEDVAAFTGGAAQTDDLTLLVVQRRKDDA
jgi:serine phosphatase RsbU (regulator of sigma subunit)